jgi:hypothetical protein
MPITVLGGTKLADTGYEVANSCRFNDGDTPTLEKSLGTPTSQQKFTWSCWFKRGVLDGDQSLFSCGSASDSERFDFRLNSGGEFYFNIDLANNYRIQTADHFLFRDVSAWYHIVLAYDTTQATDTNRVKFYVNGKQITGDDIVVTNYPAQNYTITAMASGENVSIGKRQYGSALNLDAYIAEVCYCDGQTLAATDFGEYNEDSPNIWQPKDVSGLTFGNNGFYLDFEDSSNLGNDANGGTDLTESNLAAADQATDTPTNNFCTLNSRFHTNWQQQVTNTKGFAQGNCTLLENTHSAAIGTMGTTTMPFYYEVKLSSNDMSIGVMATNPAASITASIYSYADATAYGYYPYSPYKITGGSWASDSTFTGSGTYHFAVDPVNNKLWIGKDGTWDGDPAAGTGNIVDLGTHEYTPWAHCSGSGGTNIAEFNFGGCSAFDVSSGNADANGYGNFEFSVPSGYLALCSKNLGENG